MRKFSLDNEVVVQIVKGVEEISTQREEDSYLLCAIMTTIILKSNDNILKQLNDNTTQLKEKTSTTMCYWLK